MPYAATHGITRTTTATTGMQHAHGSDQHASWALRCALTGAFMLVEFAGGLLASSLALMADAGHMLTDAAALALAWAAVRIAARRPIRALVRLSAAARARDFRQRLRAAVHRRVDRDRSRAATASIRCRSNAPRSCGSAALGLAVNLVVFAMLRRGDSHDMNISAATLHVIGDLLGSVGGDRRGAGDSVDRLAADRSAAVAARRAR